MSNYNMLVDQLSHKGIDVKDIDALLEAHEIYPKPRTKDSHQNFKAAINKNPVRRDLINKLYLEFGIDRNRFLGDIESDERRFLSESYLKRYDGQEHSLKNQHNLLDLVELPSPNGESFQSKYYDRLKNIISSSTEKINVWEHLGLGNLLNESKDLDKYFKANRKIYKLIEAKLGIEEEDQKKKEFEDVKLIKEYKRVLALSFDNNLFKKTDKGKYREIALLECSHATFHHMCSTLSNSKLVKVSFYANAFKRMVHYCIIDESYILVETYKNYYDYLHPNLLFIYQVSKQSKIKTLYDQYFHEINANLGNNLKISKGNINRLLTNSEKYLKDEINKRDNLIREIESLKGSKSEEEVNVLDSFQDSLKDQGLLLGNLEAILLSKRKILDQFPVLCPKKS